MGQKKKKKHHHHSKGRTPLKKDHSSGANADDNDLLSDEITALSAIFQEDCQVEAVRGSLPQIIVKLRPYSKDMGFEDVDVSSLLVVRCLPGYPYKSPKLQVIPERGLSEDDAQKLLSLLHDQANSNAREGRVMIFNLVEAAQEFLSEIVPREHLHESDLRLSMDSNSQLLHQDIAKSSNLGGSFVYGFIDLFSGSGESWDWAFGLDENSMFNSSLPSRTFDGVKVTDKFQERDLQKFVGPLKIEDKKKDLLQSPLAQLDSLKEESEESDKSTSVADSDTSLAEKSDGNSSTGEAEDFLFDKQRGDEDGWELGSECSNSVSSTSLVQEQVSQTFERDLIMVHLLRLACTSNGPFPNALQQLSTELYNLGVLSEQAKELALEQSTPFNKIFDHAFHKNKVSSKLSILWKHSSDVEGPSTSLPNSRYLNDFEELHSLGHGGFGHVVLCKNKIDGRHYAVKKIRLKDKSLPLNDRILRYIFVAISHSEAILSTKRARFGYSTVVS